MFYAHLCRRQVQLGYKFIKSCFGYDNFMVVDGLVYLCNVLLMMRNYLALRFDLHYGTDLVEISTVLLV